MQAPLTFTLNIDHHVLKLTCQQDALEFQLHFQEPQAQPADEVERKNPVFKNKKLNISFTDSGAKSLRTGRRVSIYRGRFGYDDVAQDAKNWFADIGQVYQAFQQGEKPTIIRSGEQESSLAQVHLKYEIKIKTHVLIKICKFPLQFITIEEQKETNSFGFDSEENQNFDGNLPLPLQNIKNEQISVAQSATDEILRTRMAVDDLKNYVHDFIELMEDKWLQITEEVHKIKVKERRQALKLQELTYMSKNFIKKQIYEPIPDENLREVYLHYKFSEKFRNEDIKLITPTCAKCFSSDFSFKIIMIDPTSFLTRTDSLIKVFKLKLKVKHMGNYIAMGICEKQKVKTVRFRGFDTETTNHGCYLLDWAGFTWSDYLTKDTKQVRELQFGSEDVITMTFKTNSKMLKFQKQKTDECFEMMICPALPLHSICFCVYVSGNSDEVEIIESGRADTGSYDMVIKTNTPRLRRKKEDSQEPIILDE